MNNIIIYINDDIKYNLELAKIYYLFKSFEVYKKILLSNKKLSTINLYHDNGEHYLNVDNLNWERKNNWFMV